MSYLDDNDRWLSAATKAERKLKAVLAKHLSEEAAEEITAAFNDLVEAATDDVKDNIRERGSYRRDY